MGVEPPERDLIETLPAIYPTPEAMREAADRLANDRQDQLTSDIVQLMRGLADAMESGKLLER